MEMKPATTGGKAADTCQHQFTHGGYCPMCKMQVRPSYQIVKFALPAELDVRSALVIAAKLCWSVGNESAALELLAYARKDFASNEAYGAWLGNRFGDEHFDLKPFDLA